MSEQTATTETETKATAEEIKAMLAAYRTAEMKRDAAKLIYENANAEVNAACAILGKRGGKGRYKINGEIVLLTSRLNKKLGTETFYFRGKNDDDEVLGGD